MQQRLELLLGGRVQGVGFRPFVFQLASRLQLTGWVRNEKGQVRIQVQGNDTTLHAFQQQLLQQAPVTARPERLTQHYLEPVEESDFVIQPSRTQHAADIHVPPDYFLCPDCLSELQDPADRRYAYPFINCTACGPRYTLIQRLPYDRANTSMAAFDLCPACQAEYRDPHNRRFHAEPIACPECGPQLQYQDAKQTLPSDEALQAALAALELGEIIIIKGVGGYHLCCDASRADSIAHLRERKQRPDKPLAVMFPARGKDELEAVRAELQIDPIEADCLRSPARPIVLLARRP